MFSINSENFNAVPQTGCACETSANMLLNLANVKSAAWECGAAS